MHKWCIEGQPQTYQQLVNIKELIMTICNWTPMKTLAKSMHSPLEMATMGVSTWTQQWHLKGNPKIKQVKIISISSSNGTMVQGLGFYCKDMHPNNMDGSCWC
jgi:hypothetical protein